MIQKLTFINKSCFEAILSESLIFRLHSQKNNFYLPKGNILTARSPTERGFELARAVRAEPTLARVRLAALSGWGTDEDRIKDQEAGMDHHLTKPVMLDEVAGVLAKVTGGIG